MVRLIDADRLEDDCNLYDKWDAEPVRQGKWIPRTAMTFFGTEETLCMMCSACGTDALTGEGFEYMPKYCPHCGARMDEE